ncbi:MAG: hypothetical protein EBU07_07720 [Betaproteobacteria bacterium]|nr:hypothetical protein [Betaproteobacteria bacterium]NBS48120.1 hypothetical protein [Betaproteobacteria bacterium]
MAKPKVIRNESAHGVRVRDGSSVAESHSHETREQPPEAPAAPAAKTASAVVKQRAERRVAPPDDNDAVVRPKTKLRRAPPQVPIEEPVLLPTPVPPPAPVARPVMPQPVYRPLRTSQPVASPVQPAPSAEAAWEPGNAIVHRISSLKNRNAKLYDLIQRLRQPKGPEGR